MDALGLALEFGPKPVDRAIARLTELAAEDTSRWTNANVLLWLGRLDGRDVREWILRRRPLRRRRRRDLRVCVADDGNGAAHDFARGRKASDLCARDCYAASCPVATSSGNGVVRPAANKGAKSIPGPNQLSAA